MSDGLSLAGAPRSHLSFFCTANMQLSCPVLACPVRVLDKEECHNTSTFTVQPRLLASRSSLNLWHTTRTPKCPIQRDLAPTYPSPPTPPSAPRAPALAAPVDLQLTCVGGNSHWRGGYGSLFGPVRRARNPSTPPSAGLCTCRQPHASTTGNAPKNVCKISADFNASKSELKVTTMHPKSQNRFPKGSIWTPFFAQK